MRGEAKVTLLQAYCISLPCDTALWTRIIFTQVLFRLSVFLWLQWMVKSSNVSASSFFVKLSKTATETLEILCEAFGEHSLRQRAGFKWHSCFKDGWVSVDDDERSGQPSTSKMTENAEKIWELIHEDRPEQSMSSQTPLGSIMEFARRS
jgi:hypothetical protein